MILIRTMISPIAFLSALLTVWVLSVRAMMVDYVLSGCLSCPFARIRLMYAPSLFTESKRAEQSLLSALDPVFTQMI